MSGAGQDRLVRCGAGVLRRAGGDCFEGEITIAGFTYRLAGEVRLRSDGGTGRELGLRAFYAPLPDPPPAAYRVPGLDDEGEAR